MLILNVYRTPAQPTVVFAFSCTDFQYSLNYALCFTKKQGTIIGTDMRAKHEEYFCYCETITTL